MTARVHSPRQQQQQQQQDSGSKRGGDATAGTSSAAAAAAAAAVVAAAAAVARLQQQQQQQQQQHHLFIEESSTSPNPSPCTTPSPGPKLADGRRANKPLMEKRRRARINQSLAALKALILDSARLENTKHSKLEKADILELTVRHLQRQRSLAQPGLSRYKAGYQDCSREVSRYLDAPDIITGNTTPMEPAVKQRLLRHLDSCVSELDLDLGSRPDSGLGSSPGSVTERVLGPGSPLPLEHPHHAVAHCSAALGAALIKQEMPELVDATRPDSSTAPGDENNNSSRPTSAFGQMHPSMAGVEQPAGSQPNPNMLSVVQVIPSRLPDGQVVFLLPSHYVQLAAAAAANGISIGPNPPTAIWAATNMSLLKASDKLIKRPLCDDTGDWSDGQLKPVKVARVETSGAVEQPLDFTTSSVKKLKAAAARLVQQQQSEAAAAAALLSHPQVEETQTQQPVKDEKPEPSARTPGHSPGLQPVKDEEGMWRPW
ncbi:PREDICTED: protein hairy-like [Ceratosolen solmsi marchali]|uniref:Protein hairy-like n=1 Tax=Ceratosolen solmsi marchali TaxID=326594 RepID=A0AAJ6YCI1_9HYME|nr:PREDICTED: protein hairy-like [Ceratosolen solmsi marchali]